MLQGVVTQLPDWAFVLVVLGAFGVTMLMRTKWLRTKLPSDVRTLVSRMASNFVDYKELDARVKAMLADKGVAERRADWIASTAARILSEVPNLFEADDDQLRDVVVAALNSQPVEQKATMFHIPIAQASTVQKFEWERMLQTLLQVLGGIRLIVSRIKSAKEK
jgi:hypothetical protein